MAKKGTGLRVWFRKLSIKRFNGGSAQHNRKSSCHSPQASDSSSTKDDHGFDHGMLITSPYHSLGSDNANSLRSPHHNSSGVAFPSSLPSRRTLPAFHAPRRHSFAAILPATRIYLASPPASSGRRRRFRASMNSRFQNLHPIAVLLSPIERKAEKPHAASPAAAIAESPSLQSIATASPTSILSPPIISPAQSHGFLFRSPLHPLGCHSVAKSINKRSPTKAIRSRNGSRTKERFIGISSRKEECFISTSRHHLSASKTVQAHLQCAKTTENSNAYGRISNTLISDRQSALIVDCGCKSTLSSSFRKTKRTLQGCGPCNIRSSGGLPLAHERNYEHTLKKLNRRARREAHGNVDGHSSLPSTTPSCIRRLDGTCISVAEKSRFGNDIPLKTRRQSPNGKRKSDVVESFAPIKPPNSQNPGSVRASISVHGGEIKENKFNKSDKGLGGGGVSEYANTERNSDKHRSNAPLRDANSTSRDLQTLMWEKDFSSFTSEDTFFSSYERSRPSFSSNSSSECIDKRRLITHTNPALNYMGTLSSKIAGANARDSYGFADIGKSLQHDPDHALVDVRRSPQHDIMSPSNPFEAVSFNEFNLNHHRWKTVAAFRGGMRTPVNSSIVEIPFRKDSKCGVKHSTNPLIGIMEAASCEEGDTSASRDDKPDRKEFTPYFRSTQARKRSISSPEYICNSHSDYYGSGRAQSVRTTRTRKKSGKDACQGSMEKDSARMRRRAQSQTKWRLRGQRVDRHSWLRSGPEDVINIKPYPNEDDEVSSEMRISREQHPESSVLASAIYVHSELENHRGDEGVSNQHSDGDAQSSFDEKSRLTDSVPVVKQSRDPLVDFRDSMMDMVIERQIYTVEDLSELLRCFLTLNPSEHHDTIVRAFTQVWGSIFGAD